MINGDPKEKRVKGGERERGKEKVNLGDSSSLDAKYERGSIVAPAGGVKVRLD